MTAASFSLVYIIVIHTGSLITEFSPFHQAFSLCTLAKMEDPTARATIASADPHVIVKVSRADMSILAIIILTYSGL